jgi:hypothetical protein
MIRYIISLNYCFLYIWSIKGGRALLAKCKIWKRALIPLISLLLTINSPPLLKVLGLMVSKFFNRGEVIEQPLPSQRLMFKR